MTRQLLCLILTLSFVAACAHNKRANRTVLARSSFDFQCPEGDIELTVLDDEGARDLASQIAARGCGSQAVYVYVPDTNTWVLNGPVRPTDAEVDDAEDAAAVQTLVTEAVKLVSEIVRQEQAPAEPKRPSPEPQN
ncbi:MAG: hypothetical protein AAF997_14155 [Myxococcota bacterium]